MDKSVRLKTAMLQPSCSQRHAESLVTTHREHFLPKSSSNWYLHPCMRAGIQHASQENTTCSLSPLERGVRDSRMARAVACVCDLSLTKAGGASTPVKQGKESGPCRT